MTRARGGLLLGMALLLPGAALLAHGGFVRAKGAVGVVLIEHALAATLADAKPRPPWPWADMHPVARLSVPRLGVERAVLSNASGSALAFGLGRVPGTSAIAGDRRSGWRSPRPPTIAFGGPVVRRATFPPTIARPPP